MTETKIISFEKSILANQFTEFIKRPYAISWTTSKNEKISILDSFDGRMFRAGYIVKYVSDKIYFKGVNSSKNDFSIPAGEPEPTIKFKNIKDQNTRNFLYNILEERALINRLSLSVQTRSFNIINTEQKIIVRGKIIVCNAESLKNQPQKVLYLITPLRGYTYELNKTLKYLPAYSTHNNFENGILNLFGINLINFSKPTFNFNPQNSIAEALFLILKESFEIMNKNEWGIIEDIDIEFLHDYRVSARRMRSALGLIKNVLSEEISSTLIKDLKFIGTVSGLLRDLDVYLLREDEYKNMVPESWSNKEIHSIFITLKRRRSKAQKNMITLIKSENYQNIISRWETFFKNYKQHIENDNPVYETASSLIFKRYKRVLKDGKALSHISPDENFHELRITCKKLRYLMEFFSSLYPGNEIGLAINQLKKLQENLGDFNDLSVQNDTLDEFLSNASKKSNAALVQDLSGLIAVLNYKKQELRRAFYILFNEFESAQNKKLFKNLFTVNNGDKVRNDQMGN